jgi:hypothetical protein
MLLDASLILGLLPLVLLYVWGILKFIIIKMSFFPQQWDSTWRLGMLQNGIRATGSNTQHAWDRISTQKLKLQNVSLEDVCKKLFAKITPVKFRKFMRNLRKLGSSG